jgi:uncharacterized membrane protein YfcA
VSKTNQVISINRRSCRGRFHRRHNRLPVMLGVLAGSSTGVRVLAGAKAHVLRVVFAIVIGALAIEMIYIGFTGRI